MTIKRPKNWRTDSWQCKGKERRHRDILTPSDVKKLHSYSGVRIKPVKCGKPKCQKLHYIFVYRRSGGREFYVGKMEYKH